MKNYIIRRLLIIIPEFIGITIIAFFVFSLLGDPFAELQTNPFISPADIAALRHMYGFDKPVILRYFYWFFAMLRGNFGISAVSGESVLKMIGRALPITLSINIFTFSFSLLFGIWIGFKSAIKQYSFFDHFFTGISYFGIAMPHFWFGLMLMILFSVKLHWLPPGGIITPGMDTAPFLARVLDRSKYIVMPVIVISFGSIAVWARYTRSSVLEMLRKDYVRTARAKGLSEQKVLRRHVFRNSLNPIVTLFFLSLPGLLGGSAVVEQVFSIPGMGRLVIQAVMNNDYMVAMGGLIMYAIILLISLVIADLMYAVIDPRIKYS
jgi:peptide/nickel transport system permease protein